MTSEELRMIWEKEESIAQIKGWDFSHIHGRYEVKTTENLLMPSSPERRSRFHIII